MSQREVKFGKLKLTINGEELKIGDKAPNFKAKLYDFTDYEFYENHKGKVKIISAVPSLDTSVCELQTYLLNKKSDKFPENLDVISISNDLPFAQQRFIKEKSVKDILFLTDYINHEFAKSYSLLLEEINLISRAIIIVDEDNIIRYCEYLNQNTDLPDINRALKEALALTIKQ